MGYIRYGICTSSPLYVYAYAYAYAWPGRAAPAGRPAICTLVLRQPFCRGLGTRLSTLSDLIAAEPGRGDSSGCAVTRAFRPTTTPRLKSFRYFRPGTRVWWALFRAQARPPLSCSSRRRPRTLGDWRLREMNSTPKVTGTREQIRAFCK